MCRPSRHAQREGPLRHAEYKTPCEILTQVRACASMWAFSARGQQKHQDPMQHIGNTAWLPSHGTDTVCISRVRATRHKLKLKLTIGKPMRQTTLHCMEACSACKAMQLTHHEAHTNNYICDLGIHQCVDDDYWAWLG